MNLFDVLIDLKHLKLDWLFLAFSIARQLWYWSSFFFHSLFVCFYSLPPFAAASATCIKLIKKLTRFFFSSWDPFKLFNPIITMQALNAVNFISDENLDQKIQFHILKSMKKSYESTLIKRIEIRSQHLTKPYFYYFI